MLLISIKLLRINWQRGQRLRELLKQSQSAPLGVEEHILTIYTGTNGYLDSLEVGQVRKFLVELRTYLKTNKPQFQEIISSTKTFTEDAEAILKEAIQEQRERFLRGNVFYFRNKQPKQINNPFHNFFFFQKKVLKRFGFKSFKID